MNKYVRMMKNSLLKKAFSKWRGKNFKKLVFDMETAEANLIAAKEQHAAHAQHLDQRKHDKALRIISNNKRSKLVDAWFMATRFLRALRLKQNLLVEKLRMCRLGRGL